MTYIENIFLCMVSPLLVAAPVSYTHLDVYKRQVLGHAQGHAVEPLPLALDLGRNADRFAV